MNRNRIARSSGRPVRRPHSPRSSRSFRPLLEQLEDRRLLTGYFDTIADDLSGPNGAMSKVTSGLRAVSSLANLPLINKPLGQVSQLTDSLTTFQAKLDSTLRELSPSTAESAIQDAIFRALGPPGLKVLASKTGAPEATVADVVVTAGANSVDVSIDLGLRVSFGSAVGLGVNSVPFKPDARENGSDGSFTVGLAYHNFNFGFRNAAPYFSTDALNELQFKIHGYLPSEMTVGLGFLQLTATDQTPETTPDKADLSLTFTADIKPDFSIANPQIGGGANLQLGLQSSFTAEGLPQFKTDFVFQWKLSDTSAPLGSGWGLPTLAFNKVEMNIGSFLGSLVQPLAERAQDLLEPMQPIFDLMTEPIPVIDELSAEMNGPVIDLVFMSNTLSAYPNMPQEFFNIVKAADKLRQFSQTVDRLAGRAGDHWVPLGNFNISGPSGTSLLDAPLAALGNLGLSKWSSLIFSGGKLNLQGFKDAIVDALPDGVGAEVNSLFDALTGEVAGNGLTLDFPVTRDPSGVAMAFLLGQQESDLVTATANFNVAIDKLIDLSPIPGLIVGLRASGAFTAYAKMGYDIKGLQQAIAPLYAGNNFDASKIMNGLWIDRNTRLQGDGAILVTAGVGLPDVIELTADGGLTSNLTITLSTTTSSEKIRPLAGELGNSLFNVSGTMDAVAQVTFKAGFEVLGEFIGIDKSWPFAEFNIYKFDTSNIPVPPSMQRVPVTPPQLARYDAANRVLTLNTGVDGHLRGGAISDAKDESYTIRRLPTGGLAVSAFGYVQKFNGPFDRVDVLMDDGKDRLHVIDPSSTTFYLIDGGAGDDNINVDGHVNVYIQGDRGSDTIDGGSGRERIQILTNGDNGLDFVTVGDGLVENIDPAVEIIISGDSADRLTFDNTDDKGGSKYTFYDDPNSLFWKLTIGTKGSTSTVKREFSFSGMAVRLFAGSGNDEFHGWFPQFTKVFAGAGDDTWDFGDQQPGIVPHLETFWSYFAGPGSDKLTIDATHDDSSGFKVLTNPFKDGTSSIIRWGNVARPTQMLIQGVEDTSITTNRHSGVEVDSWSDGILTINAAYAQFNADHYVTGNTSVRVVNTPKLFFVDPSSTTTQKGMGIDEFGPYLGNPIDYYQWPKTPGTPLTPVEAKLRINYDAATTSVQFFASLMTIEPSVMYSTRPWDFSFIGSLQAGVTNILKIAPPDPNNPNVASRDFNYRISDDTLTIGPLTMRAQFLNEYQLIGGQGSDTITIDSLAPGVKAAIDGGLGEDSLIIDNSINATGADWVIRDDKVTLIDQLSVESSNIEEKHYVGGSGHDRFRLLGVFHDRIEIDAGNGHDEFQFGDGIQTTAFLAQLDVEGGAGNDSFDWKSINTFFATHSSHISLKGGSGSNTLAINDKSRPRTVGNNRYEVFADHIDLAQAGFPLWSLKYNLMNSVTLNLGEYDDTVQVFGISSDIAATEQFKILGNGGSDTVSFRLFDDQGTPTLGGHLAISGGTGTDQVIVDDSTKAQGTNYQFYNQNGVGPTIVSGFYDSGIGFGVDSDVEKLDMHAGKGDDSFVIFSYQNYATALSIKAGEGSDNLAIVPVIGSIFNNVSKYAQFNFEGGSGTDSFSFNNSTDFASALYERDGARLTALPLNGDYALNMNATQFENMSVTGGSNFDLFFVDALSSGESISLYGGGGGGLSSFYVGQRNKNTQTIRGQIFLDASNGGGNLFVDNSANTTGATVHIDSGVDGLLGSAPGDTLFGAGGSLRYRNISHPTNPSDVNILLGSGADTIYAAPQTGSSLSINAGNPAEGAGDQLTLDLAQVQNPLFQNQEGRSGSVTSANRKPILWSDIEVMNTLAAATTTLLVSNHITSSTYGQLVTFTTTVSAANGTPTGTVQFKIDGQAVGSPKTLVGGKVTLDAPALSAIDHAIEALFSSDSASFANSADDFTQRVNKAPLLIKADDKSKMAGTANPALTFTASGFVNGDSTAKLTKQPQLLTTATTSSPVGSYPITVSGAASPNYTISFVPGTLKVIPAVGSIKGRTYFDVTGNGLTADDTALPSVKVYVDTNNNGVWNTNEPSGTSLADGTYTIAGVPIGSHKVRQVVPAGHVSTGPATSDYYAVTLTVGQTASGHDFADTVRGNISFLSNVAYVINGMIPLKDLRNLTKEGDVVQVTFTIAPGTQPQRLTLVTYTAPAPTFEPDTAAQQRIFDVNTGVFGPGTHTLTVSNPHSYFQVDFVSGHAIDRFGPAGSNISYSAQSRLISADNGGTRAVRTSPASLTGFVYLDANKNGLFDANERPIAGATVALTGAANQTVVTDTNGAYTFDNLPAGSYTITETQPNGYTDGVDSLGNKGGTKGNDKFSNITLGALATGSGYNFGEQQSAGTAYSGNQTQTTAWWNGASGQALIKALNGGTSSKNLGNWLSTNFKNLFGPDAGSSNDLSGKTNAQVATYYQSLYSNSSKKIESQTLALALAVYVTNATLAGSTASSYGFAISTGGLGSATANVGSSGAAFGINNGTIMTIAELLFRTNARARKGLIWNADNNSSLSGAEIILRDQAGSLLNSINNT